MTDENPDLQNRKLILELVSLTQKLERPPTEDEIDEYGEYQYQEYKEEFGNLYTALRKSGILADSVTADDFHSSEPTIDAQAEQEGEPDTTTGTSSSNQDHLAGPEQETQKENSETDSDGGTTSVKVQETKRQSSSENKSSDLLETVSTSDFAELTSFRRDILIVLAGSDILKGLEIKEELEKYYEEEIHHGRLYPNLDDLVESDLIKKTAIDKRSNGYSLTDSGKTHLEARIQWEAKLVDNLDSCCDTRITNEQDQYTNKNSKELPQSEPDKIAGQSKSEVNSSKSNPSEGVLDEMISEFEVQSESGSEDS